MVSLHIFFPSAVWLKTLCLCSKNTKKASIIHHNKCSVIIPDNCFQPISWRNSNFTTPKNQFTMKSVQKKNNKRNPTTAFHLSSQSRICNSFGFQQSARIHSKWIIAWECYVFIVLVGLEVRLNANSLIQMADAKLWTSVWPVPFAHFCEKCVNFILFDTLWVIVSVCVCFSHSCKTLAQPNSFTPWLFMIIFIFNAPLHTHIFDGSNGSPAGYALSVPLWCLSEKQRIAAFSISMKMQLCHLGNGELWVCVCVYCVLCDSHLMCWRGEHTKESSALIRSFIRLFTLTDTIFAVLCAN